MSSSTYTAPSPIAVVLRWMLGTVIVGWRYMWQVTVLHRSETHGVDLRDAVPSLPPEMVDKHLLRADDGVGHLFHRRFRVKVKGAASSAEELMRAVVCDFGRFVPREVIGIKRPGRTGEPLALGDEMTVQMPGPWNGPVRVVHLDDTTMRLATLKGHLEAGQVQFHAWEQDGELWFEVEAWARPATAAVHLLYSQLRFAKEAQLTMWVRFCRAAASAAGGRPADGIHITTEVGL